MNLSIQTVILFHAHAVLSNHSFIMLKDYVIMLNTYVVFFHTVSYYVKRQCYHVKTIGYLVCEECELYKLLLCKWVYCFVYTISYYVKRLKYYVKKLGYLVYEVCELIYTTSYYLNARLVLSTQSYYGKRLCYYGKTWCYLVESICCLVQLHGVVHEILRMRHCVDKMTREFDIITYRLDKLLVDKMTQTLT